jgi:outer membrane protein assembly factor BamB
MWRQPIGIGWAAFSVVEGRAYTQEQRGEEEWVSCYEALTGRLLWKHARATRFSEWQGGDGPRATPTVVGGRVYAIGATGIFDCLDAKTGARIWTRDILHEFQLKNLTWGVSVSPLVFDDMVVITGGQSYGPTVLAFACGDGAPLWQAGKDKASYASPILTTLAGKRVILSFNAGTLTAHDPASGAVLLDHRWAQDNFPKAAQPTLPGDDRVFVTAGYGMGCAMLKIEAAADGKFTARELWKGPRLKAQFNSVMAREGHLYGLDDGILACVDAATGQRKWKDGRYGSGQTLMVDDLLIVQAERGDVALVEAKPDGFRELGTIAALSSKTWNHPVLAGRYLFVRNDREAACYQLPVE